MAIVHVTTALEFLNALTVNGNEIYVDNDIDFNGTNLTGVTSVRGVTVHGQGHNISNMQYAYNGPRFSQATNDSYWDEINFVNCLCQNTYDAAFFDGRSGGMHFDKCKFQGKFFNFAYRSVYFTKCAFAFEPGLAWLHWSDGSGGSHEQCYFDLKEQLHGHQLTQQVSIKNCYFKGTITGQNTHLFNAGYQVFVNNVINIEFKNSGTFLINYGGNPETVSIYNATKAAGATITAQSRIVGLPNSDMQATSAADVQRVSEAIAATGFPIVY
jgi:hypothetical protein